MNRQAIRIDELIRQRDNLVLALEMLIGANGRHDGSWADCVLASEAIIAECEPAMAAYRASAAAVKTLKKIREKHVTEIQAAEPE